MSTDNKPLLRKQQGGKAPENDRRFWVSSLTRLLGKNNGSPLGRRLRLAILIVISQLLLIALAVAWLVHMIIIAVNGSVYFVERNPFILWIEVAATILIILFATGVLITQIRRLGERRRDDDRRDCKSD